MKKILVLLLILCMILGNVSVNAAKVGNQQISAAGACVMDFDTGEILYSYYGDTPRVPASMTKIMNLYCVYEALANGEITLQTRVPISQNVYNKSRNALYQSVLPLNYNTTYTVDEMINVVIIHSASGAAVALAELVGGGSEAVFVERMNNKAKEWGIDAYYYDSCGIAQNQVSPIAMATLARNLMRDYPDILTRSSRTSVYFHGGNYKTTNHLLDTYYYSGADGLKTGTTAHSGYCFCGTAVRDGRRMISVVMRAASTGQRFIDTARLLDYGFAVMRDKYDTLYFTDMRTFIDGNEIPTFSYDGGKPRAMIVAEDLKDYGFDINFDNDANTVYVTQINAKTPTPISMDSYRSKSGKKAFTVLKNNNISVVVKKGNTEYKVTDVLNLGGYMAIGIDELANVFSYNWDFAANSAIITTANTPQSIMVTVNGANVKFDDQTPIIVDENTLIPIRAVSESMGKEVVWDQKTQSVTIKDEATTLILTIGNKTMTKTTDVNEKVELETSPIIINERVCVPIRAIAESFGMSVTWNNDTKTVAIKRD